MYENLFQCKGKVAVVTGGAGRIGRELVKAFADFGARVYLADVVRKEKAMEAVRKKGVRYIYLDISSEESIRQAIQSVVRKEGKIDMLVNSALPRPSGWNDTLKKLPFLSWTESADEHLTGYFLCSREVAEQMKKRRKGSIINIASVYGVVAPDFSVYEGTDAATTVAYVAIKGGIISMTRYLAMYYAKHQVRINIVSPGGILAGQHPKFVERYCGRTPLGRMGAPQDVVGAVLFLASDASVYITGHNLIVDGGLSAW